MILNKITLQNFRQYYGEVTLDFPYGEAGSVSVIHGENGVGKTAFLNAVKWAFHAKFTEPKMFRADQLINLSAFSEGIRHCQVSINFMHDGDSYRLVRRYEYHAKSTNRTGSLKLWRIEDGIHKDVNEPQYFINTIMPAEMSDYYFFHGEQSTAVQISSAGFDLKQSIERVLGFDVANRTLERLKSSLQQVRKEISKLDQSNAARKLYEQIQRKSDRLKAENNKIFELEKTIKSLTNELSETEDAFSTINNSDLSSLRSELNRRDAELRAIESDLIKIYKSKAESINKFGWSVFGHQFADEDLDFVDDSVLAGRLPEPYNETFINELLSASECICGADLTKDSPAYNKVKELLKKASNPLISARLGQVRSFISHVPFLFDQAESELIDLTEKLNNAEVTRYELKRSIKVLNEKISTIPVSEIQRLQTKKIALKKDLGIQQQLLGGAKRSIELLTSEIQQLESQYARLTGSLGAAEVYRKREKFLLNLIDSLQNHLEKTIQGVKFHIAQNVNKMLSESTAQSLSISFLSKDSFNFSVLNTDRQEIEPSTGQTLVLNLAVVSALFQFIQMGTKAKDPLLHSARNSTLVVDAPFGVLDKSYRRYVVSMLPKYAPQVIFLVTSSQWTEDMVIDIKDDISSEYALLAEQTGPRNDRPLRKYVINGIEYNVDTFDCDRDCTVALRIV